jgi:hypothetical protein
MSTYDELIQLVEKPEDDFVKVIVYGSPGVGKTQFASTFPNPFFIDVDKGMRTLKGNKPPFIELRRDEDNYKVLIQLIRDFDKHEGKFKVELADRKTLVLDGITSLASNFLAQLMASGDFYALQRGGYGHAQKRSPDMYQSDQGDYGVLTSRLYEVFARLKDLKCNIVVTAHEMEKEKDGYVSFRGPATVGNFREELGYQLDELMYMSKEGAGERMKVLLYPHGFKGFPGKSRSHLPEKIENPTYETVFGKGEK